MAGEKAIGPATRLERAVLLHARYGEQIGSGLLLLWMIAAIVLTRYVPVDPWLSGGDAPGGDPRIFHHLLVGAWAVRGAGDDLFFLLAMLFSVARREPVFVPSPHRS